ncbi:DUF1430 domain-containing protein [Lactococcus ileimucosae]|uniref:DUF1430 domain-containing protein n=1 Tax=Lactococcus ileimucosae TaxID=2941329 RepID=UPI00204309F0|nr:DUF1430 domain-containing protein [Lactococcus ileimucosae]
MNKLLKFVLLLLFIVISLSSAHIIKNNLADAKIKEAYNLPNHTKVYLPASLIPNKDLIATITEVSKHTGTSFILRNNFRGAQHDGKGNVDFLKKKNEVIFFQTDYKSKDKRSFLSRGFTYKFWNAPLDQSALLQLKNSPLYVSNKNKENALEDLSKKLSLLSETKEEISPEKLVTPPTSYYDDLEIIMYTNYDLTFFIGTSILFFVILLFVFLSGNNKTIATYRLNGISSYKIGRTLLLREFSLVGFVTYLTVSFLSFKGFNLNFSLLMLFMTGLVLSVSYMTIAIVSNFSLANQINSKSFFKYSHYILYALKAFVFLVTVAGNAGVLYLVNSGSGNSSQIENKYAVLSPNYVAHGMNFNTAPDLFHYAEKNDGLYVDYGTHSIDEHGALNVLQINVNYLSQFPALSDKNQPFKVDTQENAGIVLIEEKYKPNLEKIKAYYDSAKPFKTSDIKYYFIKDKQKFDLLNGKNEKFFPSIIEVYTPQNLGDYNDFLNRAALKFKLKNTKEETYQELKPILKSIEALENQPSLVKIGDINKTTELSMVGTPISYAFTKGLVILIFLAMLLATTLFYFETYKKNSAVKNLYGTSFYKTYRPLFAIILLQGGLFLIYALTQTNQTVTLQALLFFLFIEIIVIIVILVKLQKGLLLDVLKGE